MQRRQKIIRVRLIVNYSKFSAHTESHFIYYSLTLWGFQESEFVYLQMTNFDCRQGKC